MGTILNVMICISFCLTVSFVLPPLVGSNQMVDNSVCLECHDTTSGGEEDIHTIHSSSVCRQCHNGPNQAGNVSASSCIICHPLDDDKEQCQLVIYHELSAGYNPSGESCASCHSNCMGGITTTISPTTTTTVEVVIENHMMTKDPGKNTDCQIPVPETTFYSYDEAAYCWFSWDYASEEDEIIFRCYKPDGELYKEEKTLLMDSLDSVKGNSDKAELYWRLARTALKLGDEAEKSGTGPEMLLEIFEEGESYASRAIELDADNHLGYFWKSANIGRWGQIKGVLNALRKAEMSPSSCGF